MTSADFDRINKSFIMKPTPTELKQINPILEKFTEEEINSLIKFLFDNGFTWLDDKKIFYNNKLQFSLRTMGLDLFVNNHDFIKKQVGELEAKYNQNPEKYNFRMKEISIWKSIQKSSLVFGLLGLFFGRLIFSMKVWIFYEIFCLIAFIVSIRVQAFLLKEIDNLPR